MNPKRLILALIVGLATTTLSHAQYEYEARVQSRDRVLSPTGQGMRKLAQFGAPSLNDKGDIAFPTTLNNTRIYGVGFRAKGKRPGRLVTQTPFEIESFVVGKEETQTINVKSVKVDLAINNKQDIVYSFSEPGGTIPLGDINIPTSGYYGYGKISKVKASNPKNEGILAVGDSTAIVGFNDTRMVLSKSGDIGVTIQGNSNSSIEGEATTGLFYLNRTEKGKLKTIAQTELFVEGLPYEVIFSSFGKATLSTNNTIYTVANFGATGVEPVPEGLFNGIWRGQNQNLKNVVSLQQNPPGDGDTYEGFRDAISPSSNGRNIAFIAQVGGATALFVTDTEGNNVQRIATVGKTRIADKEVFTDIESAAINNKRELVIVGSSELGRGIWTVSRSKEFQLIAREKQTLKTNEEGAKEKTVTRLTFNPNSGLNRFGQVAFTANFTDRTSAVIIATPK